MSDVVTLAERHQRNLDHMRTSIVEIDALLIAYARLNEGRFIRYGSTTRIDAVAHGDIDIIAHFEDEASLKAASYAEELCFARGLKPDVRPSCWASDSFLKLVAAGGVILE